ncbi:MAG: hypothetical protein BGO38_16410 [Cellulomonas sp. 73-145]|uniref:DUF4235 domain-containing protein n=1 Tax=Cellulomonas sp. 73-145 TaxID=1895739 RepID=UPI0009263109|nr:DUF4235 domain-containing protein [Cellulomonas sp. 73-145]OJV58914.1 MAG: hypothetical protein BGO38_16410 [Cellulomonas sp. 73-145]
MPEKQSQSMLAKLVGAGVAVGAAWLAQKLLDRAWVAAAGHEPPAPESQDDDISLREVLLAAAITGAVVALARALASRGTARLTAKVNSKRPELPA